MRQRLPSRRTSELISFQWRLPRGGDGGTVHVTFSREKFVDGTYGRIVEIFIDPSMKTNDLAQQARDAALLMSIALQHGATIEELAEGVGREEDIAHTPQSIVGAVLDQVLLYEREQKK